ncbi:MAG: TetR/AcrR family transcriptional regulator C-terminal domain-containing protein [Lactococcus plantarum]|nr:TetR/AcrR family transcriptional regulator C-terminal domain-containing protein [Lactococcus plantarum]MDN6084030.1 TetR/AcrR family transcriptional regulator C-terminal domain-containing protein [Lactococcus plantarum]
MIDRKEQTKVMLRDAMSQLLQEKAFDQITTTELVKVAKISRSGFYTHYKDKRDMIDEYQKALFNKIEYIFEKNKGFLKQTMLETYELLYTNDLYAALFSKNGNQESQQFMQNQLKLILDRSALHEKHKLEQLDDLADIYATTYYANAIFGLTQTWIYRKRKESPEQIASLLMLLVNKGDL